MECFAGLVLADREPRMRTRWVRVFVKGHNKQRSASVCRSLQLPSSSWIWSSALDNRGMIGVGGGA